MHGTVGRMSLTPQQKENCFRYLGVTPQDVKDIRQAPSFQVAEERLASLQKRVKTSYKQAVVRLHPDRNPDDPNAGDALKVLNEFHEWFSKLRLEPPRPRPQPGVWSAWSNTTSTTTTSYSRATVRQVILNGQVVIIVE